MKIIKTVLFILLMAVSAMSFGQRWKLSRSELVGGIGVSNYFGDIGGAIETSALGFGDIDILSTKSVLAIGYRYKLYDRIAIKANLNYAKIYGTDVKSINESRNYTFSSNMFELNAHVEYHFTKEKSGASYSVTSLRGKLGNIKKDLNFYAFAGLGVAYFKPKAFDEFLGSTRFVEDKNLALVIPFGLGVKYPISSKASVGLELGRRFITSDYIDGFGPEASTSRDLYYFTVINVSYKIEKRKKGRGKYRF